MLLLARRTLALASRSAPKRGLPVPQAPGLPVTACRAMFAGKGADKLFKKSCEGACSKDTPLVSKEEMPELLEAVPAWTTNTEGTALSRTFTAKNFTAAIRFFNKVAEVAEAEGHHPDLHLRNYREVEVVVSTHAAGGLTLYDFILAAKLDQIEVDYSPKWLEKQMAAKQAATAKQAA